VDTFPSVQLLVVGSLPVVPVGRQERKTDVVSDVGVIFFVVETTQPPKREI
jgi:hypothetical protein